MGGQGRWEFLVFLCLLMRDGERWKHRVREKNGREGRWERRVREKERKRKETDTDREREMERHRERNRETERCR